MAYNSTHSSSQLSSTPRKVIVEKLSGKRFVFIAILITIAAVLSIYYAAKTNPINKVMDIIGTITSNEIASSLIEVDIVDELDNLIKPVKTIVSLIVIGSRLPSILLAISLWIMYFGAKNRDKYKSIFKGSTILSILIGFEVFKACTIPFLLIVAGILLIAYIGSSVITISLILIVIGSIALCFLIPFDMKITKMINGMQYTYNLNDNYLYVYGYVTFILWILGIFSILSAFGFGFTTMVPNLCKGLAYIISATFLSSYKRALPQPKPNKTPDLMKNPAQYLNMLKPKVLNGEPVFWIERMFPDINKNNIRVQYDNAKPSAEQNAPSNNQQQTPNRVQNVSEEITPIERFLSTKQVSTEATQAKPKTQYDTATKAMTAGKSYESLEKELEINLLKLFDKDISILSERFTSIGSTSLIVSENIPVIFKKADMITDSISGRLLLRVDAFNNTEIGVSEIVLNIIPKGDVFNPLGKISNISYNIDPPIKKDEHALADYGIILPDEATNGEITIVKIKFEDGLFWDKPNTGLRFSSKHKTDFDKDLYLKAHDEN